MKRTFSSPSPKLLDTDEQEQIIQNFALRIEQQRALWKNVFVGISVFLAFCIFYAFVVDSGWYPSLLNRATYGQTPSLATSRYLTAGMVLSLLCTGATFHRPVPGRAALYVISMNILMSLLLAAFTSSKS